MLVLILGLIVFIGAHSVRIVAPAWRDRMVARFGEGAWKGVYSLVALLGIVLIVWGYALARQSPIVLWDPPVWTRHLALVLMFPVFVLLAAAYLPGHIKATLQHPMLTAVKLWAVAHLLANGTLADVVLFGSLLAWAVVDRISVKRREATAPPATAATPKVASDLIAFAIGLALYAVFVFYLHEWLFGVAPLEGR